MAIFHLSAQIIGRSTGRSAVAAAAYRAGGRLAEASTGIAYDYTRKTGVIHEAVLLPAAAPERLAERERLWNEVEAGERRKDAQLAREIELALPRELADAEVIELARCYVQEQFVARGMIADLAVHNPVGKDGEARPHAHVMLTLRSVGEDGFGRKEVAWNSRALLHDWREALSVLTNQMLAERGHGERVDHRSYRERGLMLEPQSKIGAPGRSDRAKGTTAQRTAEHRAIAARNGERIAAEPGIALAALTEHRASFTRRDLARLVATHSDGAAQFARVMARVEASPELVRLGSDGRGEVQFTSRAMQASERGLRASADTLATRRGHAVDRRRREEVIIGAGLGSEQADAVRHLTRDEGVSLLVGYAGTGKSTMLGTARAVWEGEGRRVRGAALSGIAAEGLERGSGIASRTLASLEHAWGRGREPLRPGEVLVVDEAGMVGTRQMARVLAHAAAVGAKVVLVGDPEQLQSIQAGGWFGALVARHGAGQLAVVRRQRDGWQRQATVELATARTGDALVRYEAAGMLRTAATHEAARTALIEAWAHDRQAVPERSQLMLAATRQDVEALNAMARARLQRDGALAGERAVATSRGERPFATGDRVLFLRNERSLGVKNGTLGTVERIERQAIAVRLDDGRRIMFDPRDYPHLAHGYATTVHKAQGATVDISYVLLTGHLDRHGSYVALSRHRVGTAAFYAGDRFGSLDRLAARLGRDGRQAPALPVDTRSSAGRAVEAARPSRLAGLRAALGRVRGMARGPSPSMAGTERQPATTQPAVAEHDAALRHAAARLREQATGWGTARPSAERSGVAEGEVSRGLPARLDPEERARLHAQEERARQAGAELRARDARRTADEGLARLGPEGRSKLRAQELQTRDATLRLRLRRQRDRSDGLEL